MRYNGNPLFQHIVITVLLIVISPAKTLDFDTPPITRRRSMPQFMDEATALIGALGKLSPPQLEKLMNISPKLAALNFERHLQWGSASAARGARPALLAFRGDVYTGLEADSFEPQDFSYAQKHLRILSGLYGLLRPLDLIRPYRLEMGTRLPNSQGDTLYDFWGDRITRELNRQLRPAGGALVNLASGEYFKVIQPEDVQGDIYTPVFQDYKDGRYKVISFFAKRARGMMSAWIIKNRVSRPRDLRDFDGGGYRYAPGLSAGRHTLVFTRRPA